jgi:hypothetical protein
MPQPHSTTARHVSMICLTTPTQPPAEVVADRDRRAALDLTPNQMLLGDPCEGRSALEARPLNGSSVPRNIDFLKIVPVRGQKIGETHAETTGKVVVANSGLTKLACLPGQRPVSRPIFERNGNNAAEHLYYFRRCKPEIPVSPLADHGQQVCLD